MYDKGRTYYWKHILFPVIQNKDKPHGPEFWMIYGQLMNRAKAIGVEVSPCGPIVDF
jgi:hypothetical protein